VDPHEEVQRHRQRGEGEHRRHDRAEPRHPERIDGQPGEEGEGDPGGVEVVREPRPSAQAVEHTLADQDQQREQCGLSSDASRLVRRAEEPAPGSERRHDDAQPHQNEREQRDGTGDPGQPAPRAGIVRQPVGAEDVLDSVCGEDPSPEQREQPPARNGRCSMLATDGVLQEGEVREREREPGAAEEHELPPQFAESAARTHQ